jgi:ATP-dependent Lon protease
MVSNNTDNNKLENEKLDLVDPSTESSTDPSTDTVTTSDSEFIVDDNDNDNDYDEEYEEDYDEYDVDVEINEDDIISIEEMDNTTKNDKLLLVLKRLNQIPNRFNKSSKSIITKKTYKFTSKYNKKDIEYFNNLSDKDKNEIEKTETALSLINNNSDIPLRFKFLGLNIPNTTKNVILSKINILSAMECNSGEYFKLNNWLYSLNTIPLGVYNDLPIKHTDNILDIQAFLNNSIKKMNDNIFGHKEAKEQIIRILAQWISCPTAHGHVIGIQGSAGVGKTKLITEGICNTLNFPHAFISLGGTSDAAFLKGHSFTYEGAVYGKICESLIKTRVMNPVILFDELDKVSGCYKGDEIINTLIHITDPVQNSKYTDRYFEEIDLDLSRATIIFTYNDVNLINPILKDRMITINVPGYNSTEKLTLAKDYLMPEILKQYNINKGDIIIDDTVLKYIIDDIEKEEGVRNLKRAINNVISHVNMMKYIIIDDIKVKYPFNVNINYYNKYCKNNMATSKNSALYSMYL